MPMLSLTEITSAPVAELVARASAEPVPDSARVLDLGHSVESDALIRAELARTHLRLGVDEAIRNRGLGFPQERLVRVATIAVVEAANDFDPVRDGSFTSYARARVRRALDRAMAS